MKMAERLRKQTEGPSIIILDWLLNLKLPRVVRRRQQITPGQSNRAEIHQDSQPGMHIRLNNVFKKIPDLSL